LERKVEFSRNNLDFLRLLFALIVVFYHIAILTHLNAFSSFGKYLSGDYAVKSFFVISGMLIYRSYSKSSSLASYLAKRVRRIYPAYFTIVALAAVVLFPLSTLPASRYFGPGFWKYIAANLVFLSPSGSLPGVFTSNSLPAVNGALWTLKIEVLFYLFVPVIAYLCDRIGPKKALGTLFCLSCLWKYGFGLLSSQSASSLYRELGRQLPGQLIYFIAGIVALLYFDKLKLHFPAILGISSCLFLADHFFFRGILDVLWVSGIVFVFGFWRYLGNFSKYGDFSYGTYIVHFPLIQTMISLGLAKQSSVIFVLVTVSCIAAGAFLMWHLVEKRFLARSSHYRQISMAASGQALSVCVVPPDTVPDFRP
jgi:peptidoglycan/LPS O-acetylase OafA/YrhL